MKTLKTLKDFTLEIQAKIPQYNVYSNCYYNWFEFIRKEFNIELSINNDFQKCFSLQRKSNIYSCIFSEYITVVCKYPKKVYRNQNNDLHNTNGIAVEWGSLTGINFDCYYINGRNMPKWIFDKYQNGTLKKKTF